MENTIYSINGPVVTIKGKTDLEMMEMVYVGKVRLVGEVIRMNDRETTIQVYEEKNPAHVQSEVMTRLMYRALGKAGADLVLPLDADEFLIPADGEFLRF